MTTHAAVAIAPSSIWDARITSSEIVYRIQARTTEIAESRSPPGGTNADFEKAKSNVSFAEIMEKEKYAPMCRSMDGYYAVLNQCRTLVVALDAFFNHRHPMPNPTQAQAAIRFVAAHFDREDFWHASRHCPVHRDKTRKLARFVNRIAASLADRCSVCASFVAHYREHIHQINPTFTAHPPLPRRPRVLA